MKNKDEVIKELQSLTKQKGFVYALCMIIYEDFNIPVELIHTTNQYERISHRELSLVLGLLIQSPLNLAYPNSYNEIIDLKDKIYSLLKTLHESISHVFSENLNELLNNKDESKKSFNNFFGSGEMLLEPIFYSGTGIFDFQYLDYLPQKYKYDREWLLKNRNFDFDDVVRIAKELKQYLQQKGSSIRLLQLKENLTEIIDDYKTKFKETDWDLEENKTNLKNYLELLQYIELFDVPSQNFDLKNLTEKNWNNFYDSLLDIFTISVSELNNTEALNHFIANFSVNPGHEINKQFNMLGSYNILNSNPLIKINDKKYFVPLMFFVYESIYESPYYWLQSDSTYKNQLAKNRGLASEEMSLNLLVKVFGNENVYRDVKIKENKNSTRTDIDLLCILGSKALIVQVKSKKLTTLSRQGEINSIQKDFKEAVQDAYEQGQVSRNAILEKEFQFIDINGTEVILSQGIDDVYIMGITTENYPALTHQTSVMLKKDDHSPNPIFLTIFDLELLTHYLRNPFNFLYYIRQRISLMDYFKAQEESVFLGYHLNQKLWKIDKFDMCTIDTDYGQLIERNYFPYKMNLNVSKEGDTLKTEWFSSQFQQICNEIMCQDFDKVTDIIFSLYDLSEDTANRFADLVFTTKMKTMNDNSDHDFSIIAQDNLHSEYGITYFSLEINSFDILKDRLYKYCEYKKYSTKTKCWLGIGSLRDSSNLINAIYFNDSFWKFDYNMELYCNEFTLRLKNKKKHMTKNKIGRNDLCPCGSNVKYKKCCLR